MALPKINSSIQSSQPSFNHELVETPLFTSNPQDESRFSQVEASWVRHSKKVDDCKDKNESIDFSRENLPPLWPEDFFPKEIQLIDISSDEEIKKDPQIRTSELWRTLPSEIKDHLQTLLADERDDFFYVHPQILWEDFLNKANVKQVQTIQVETGSRTATIKYITLDDANDSTLVISKVEPLFQPNAVEPSSHNSDSIALIRMLEVSSKMRTEITYSSKDGGEIIKDQHLPTRHRYIAEVKGNVELDRYREDETSNIMILASLSEEYPTLDSLIDESVFPNGEINLENTLSLDSINSRKGSENFFNGCPFFYEAIINRLGNFEGYQIHPKQVFDEMTRSNEIPEKINSVEFKTKTHLVTIREFVLRDKKCWIIHQKKLEKIQEEDLTQKIYSFSRSTISQNQILSEEYLPNSTSVSFIKPGEIFRKTQSKTANDQFETIPQNPESWENPVEKIWDELKKVESKNLAENSGNVFRYVDPFFFTDGCDYSDQRFTESLPHKKIRLNNNVGAGFGIRQLSEVSNKENRTRKADLSAFFGSTLKWFPTQNFNAGVGVQASVGQANPVLSSSETQKPKVNGSYLNPQIRAMLGYKFLNVGGLVGREFFFNTSDKSRVDIGFSGVDMDQLKLTSDLLTGAFVAFEPQKLKPINFELQYQNSKIRLNGELPNNAGESNSLFKNGALLLLTGVNL